MDEKAGAARLADTTICRRAALLGAGAVGLAALAACGAKPAPSAAASSPAGAGAGVGAGGAIVALADVPVGGAVAAKGTDGKPIIVSQPTAGKVVAFSAICTHQGGTVAAATGVCPLHQSKYDLTTGAVLRGPAEQPLAPVPVRVDGASVVAGA